MVAGVTTRRDAFPQRGRWGHRANQNERGQQGSMFLSRHILNKAPSNNGLHQTGRGGVALASRRRPVIEARPAGEPGCCTGQLR